MLGMRIQNRTRPNQQRRAPIAQVRNVRRETYNRLFETIERMQSNWIMNGLVFQRSPLTDRAFQ